MSLGRRPPGIQNKAVFAGEECGGLCIVTLLVIYPESVIYRGPVVHLIHQRDTKQRKAVHTKIKNLFVALGMLSFLVQLSLLCLTLTGMFWAPQKKDKPALLIDHELYCYEMFCLSYGALPLYTRSAEIIFWTVFGGSNAFMLTCPDNYPESIVTNNTHSQDN